MNGSETLMAPCSWLRLCCAARLLASLRCCGSWSGDRAGLALLIALSLLASALALAVLALTGLGLTVFGLTVFGLTVYALPALAVALARREIGRGCLVGLADDHLGAVGQVGKAGGHHTIGGRQPAGDHR